MLVATASMLAFLSVVAARDPLTSNAAAQQTAVLRQRGSGVDAKKLSRGPVPLPYQMMQLYTVKNAVARGAVCNDGSPAAFYYRNCTANGDRHPGDPTDYCKKGGQQGVQSVQFFVYLDAADGSWCHDNTTCAARPPQYVTSEGLPPQLFPGGVLSIYPEANPNFYKQHTVFIPSCSGDLFVGSRGATKDPESGRYFAGQQIVQAVIEDLAELEFGGVQAPLLLADEVILGGGAGAMYLQDFVEALVKSAVSTVSPVLGLCDDCIIPMVPPIRYHPASASKGAVGRLDSSSNLSGGSDDGAACKDDSKCPPMSTLPLAASVWGLGEGAASNNTAANEVTLPFSPTWCSSALPAWQCLLADQLLLGGTEQQHRILVLAPQLDTTALAMNGVTPSSDPAAAQAFAAKYASAVREVANGVDFSFADGCLSNATATTGLLSFDYFYFKQLNCTQPGVPAPFLFEPIQLVASFLLSGIGSGIKMHCVKSSASLVPCTAS